MTIDRIPVLTHFMNRGRQADNENLRQIMKYFSKDISKVHLEQEEEEILSELLEMAPEKEENLKF